MAADILQIIAVIFNPIVAKAMAILALFTIGLATIDVFAIVRR